MARVEEFIAELNLPPGGSTRIVCPSCEGGASKERSMAVSRAFNGMTTWKCFRAACGTGGAQHDFAGADASAASLEKPLRPYYGYIGTLSNQQQYEFKTTYNLPVPDIFNGEPIDELTSYRRYVLPIREYDGTIRGHSARIPWHMTNINWDVPKTLTYFNKQGPLLAWYHPRFRCTSGVVLIVEDQLSAMRAAENLSLVTCAILGTGLNEEKVQELQQYTKNLVIALDADATGQAFALARKWGQAFTRCRVHVLKQDIKDMPLKDLTSLNI